MEKNNISKHTGLLFELKIGLNKENSIIIDYGGKPVGKIREALKDFKKGLTYSVDDLKAQQANFTLSQERDKRDEKDKRDKEIKEEARLASNLRSEANLAGLLTLGDWNKDFAERAAKRAMQLKESVHKWWEDKKTKMAGAAKSIIEWLLKAAALGALWLLFDWLSKQDLKKMYEDIKSIGYIFFLVTKEDYIKPRTKI